MDCQVNKSGSAMVIRVSGRLDAVTAQDFEKQCTDILSGGENNLVVDLSGVEYISSAGLRSFLVVGKKLKAANGTLSLSGLQGMVKEVFEMSGFATLFPEYPSVEEAIEAAG